MGEYGIYDINGQNDLTKLEFTHDLGLIMSVVSGDDEVAKAYVVDNASLTDAQMLSLAVDEDIVVRRELAKSKHLSAEVIALLCLDKVDIVRAYVLCNPLTDFSVFKAAVLAGKFSVATKKMLCSDLRAVSDIEVFKFLWETVRGAQQILMNTLHVAATYHVLPVIDSKVIAFAHEEILSGEASNAVREVYAGSAGLARPEILDGLKDDSCRPVINAIARNSASWVSTHEYLATKHRSSDIRTSIAMVTEDNDLLNKMYHGTKSKDIRFWVEANPAFVNKEK